MQYTIEKEVTRFEQPSVWVKVNKYQYDKQAARRELNFLRCAYRDVNFRIAKA